MDVLVAEMQKLGVSILHSDRCARIERTPARPPRSGAVAADIAETLYNYPTLSDMYGHAALKALGEDGRRASGEPARTTREG